MPIGYEELLYFGKKFGHESQDYYIVIAKMAIKFFLLNEKAFEKFNQRLQLIATHKEDFIRHPSYKNIKDEIITKLKAQKELTQTEQDILEVIEFFEEIAALKKSSEFSESLIYQQSLKDEARLIPWEEFKKFDDPINHKFSGSVIGANNYVKTVIEKSKKLATKEKYSLTNVYSFNELRNFLYILDDKARQQANNFAMLLQDFSGESSISLFYEAKSQRWMFIDYYNMQPITKEIYELITWIKKYFGTQTNKGFNFIAFETTLFINTENKKVIEELSSALKIPVESHAANYTHRYFLNMQKQLRYEPDIGLCFGLANMAMQAHLSGPYEFEKFYKRIDFIVQHPNFFSDTTTDISYKKIKNGIIKKRNAAREEAKRELKLQQQPLPTYIPVHVDLTAEEQNALEIAEFFEGVAVFQNPEKYADKINKSLIGQTRLIKISKQIQSQKFESMGGISQAASYIGIYNRYNDLNTYTEILNEKSKEISCGFALLLCSADHAITLLHEANARYWTIVDANTMRIIRLHPRELGEYVFNAFEFGLPGSLTAFYSALFSNKRDSNEIQKLVIALQDSKKFQELHNSKDKWIANRQVTLVYIAALFGFTSIISAAANSNLRSINELIDTDVAGCNPTIIAVSQGHQKALQILVDAKTLEGKPIVDLNKQTPHGETAIHVAARLRLSAILQILINARNEDGTFRANLNLKTNAGKTAIWIAVEKGYHVILRMLVAAHYDDGKPRVDLDVKFQNGSLLVQAFLNHDLESFKTLEEYGAYVNLEGLDPMGDKAFEDFLNALEVRKKLIFQIKNPLFKNNSQTLEKHCKKLTKKIFGTFKKDHTQFTNPVFIKNIEEKITALKNQYVPKQSSWFDLWRGVLLNKESSGSNDNSANKIQSARKRK
jgi:hypothetical protein